MKTTVIIRIYTLANEVRVRALRSYKEKQRVCRREKAEEEDKSKEEEEKKGPDSASKRLDREPKRNKLLHELVAVVFSVSSSPRFFL